ncbi:MAG: polyribonucleotide nucleotidyltransferase [Deltaproteobacteria bacterium]|nr:polyribonucleotide nucleotidyltransferase [Deltaproteobacteria bacterium]
MGAVVVERNLGGRLFRLESGFLAKQADGAVLARYGDTVVLATVVSAKDIREGIDFLPLTVDYLEKTYAAGKIPGGFFKREGRPSEKEILTSRLIDRAIRPLLPKGYYYETQVIAIVLSADQENDSDTVAMVAASAALTLSDIPFDGPIAGICIGKLEGQLVVNPLISQLEKSQLDLVVACGQTGIVMVEGGAKGVSEAVVLDALDLAVESAKPILEAQLELREKLGKGKREFIPKIPSPEKVESVKAAAVDKMRKALSIAQKQERAEQVKQVRAEVVAQLAAEGEASVAKELESITHDLQADLMREQIVVQGRRVDGRGLQDIRPIDCQVGILPRTHGSALFTRGETQALVIATLGTTADKQIIDALEGESYKHFMLHYNFPPFSVGEVKFLRSPGRREIGHGALAERSVAAVVPSAEAFPYTIRIVSDILESNGSSSMATICGASLSLMDAGVPIQQPVAGVAMGLIKEGEKIAILTDILGDEDHLGDMDFKVAGTCEGITGLQMDIKIKGLTRGIMGQALEQARTARLSILGQMKEAIERPRPELSVYAPRIMTLRINTNRIKDLIGPGGRNIKGIVEKTGVEIDVRDDGTVHLASADPKAAEKALQMIHELTREAEIGKIYVGKVRKIVDFGAFVEIFPGTDGLVHISQLEDRRVERVTDILQEGEEVKVKVLEIGRDGKIRLSRKAAMEEG